eukprot:TRINITY_DN53909_c0_g1_i1.p1 TRINITY_DN53909_c0_g1~~TRINITY_DN53909_c0_g1_i1.p1  ORF type:complete len:1163 (-),score=58.09 TRINITY_DN53909_c0_g1_i1:1233-4631(-)
MSSRTNQLLESTLPVQVIHALNNNLKVEQSVQFTTVLFTDVVGFTSWSSSRSAEDVAAMLNAMFTEFDTIAADNGVEKIKTIGDAYWAVSGLFVRNKYHAVSAADTAVEFIKAIREINSRNELNLSIRVGLHSGPLMGGVIGLTRMAYEVWGITNSLASKMESTGVPDRIQVSEDTRHQLLRHYNLEHNGTLNLPQVGALGVYLLGRRLHQNDRFADLVQRNVVKPVTLELSSNADTDSSRKLSNSNSSQGANSVFVTGGQRSRGNSQSTTSTLRTPAAVHISLTNPPDSPGAGSEAELLHVPEHCFTPSGASATSSSVGPIESSASNSSQQPHGRTSIALSNNSFQLHHSASGSSYMEQPPPPIVSQSSNGATGGLVDVQFTQSQPQLPPATLRRASLAAVPILHRTMASSMETSSVSDSNFHNTRRGNVRTHMANLDTRIHNQLSKLQRHTVDVTLTNIEGLGDSESLSDIIESEAGDAQHQAPYEEEDVDVEELTRLASWPCCRSVTRQKFADPTVEKEFMQYNWTEFGPQNIWMASVIALAQHCGLVVITLVTVLLLAQVLLASGVRKRAKKRPNKLNNSRSSTHKTNPLATLTDSVSLQGITAGGVYVCAALIVMNVAMLATSEHFSPTPVLFRPVTLIGVALHLVMPIVMILPIIHLRWRLLLGLVVFIGAAVVTQVRAKGLDKEVYVEVQKDGAWAFATCIFGLLMHERWLRRGYSSVVCITAMSTIAEAERQVGMELAKNLFPEFVLEPLMESLEQPDQQSKRLKLHSIVNTIDVSCVMFCQFVGLESLCSGSSTTSTLLNPKNTLRVLNTLYSEIDLLILQRFPSLCKIKGIGPMLLVASNVPKKKGSSILEVEEDVDILSNDSNPLSASESNLTSCMRDPKRANANANAGNLNTVLRNGSASKYPPRSPRHAAPIVPKQMDIDTIENTKSNHCAEMLKLAVAIRRHIARFKESHKNMGETISDWDSMEINVSIGVALGPVTGAVVGTSKFLWDIFGDTVNTSSRMLSTSTSPNTISCTEAVVNAVAEFPEFGWTPSDREVKGKGTVTCFELQHATDRLVSPTLARTVSTSTSTTTPTSTSPSISSRFSRPAVAPAVIGKEEISQVAERLMSTEEMSVEELPQ